MLQRLIRPQRCLRATSPLFRTPTSVLQSRRQHNVPELVHEKTYTKEGVPGLMSPEAYDFAWIQYQTFILEKLNLMTQDTEDAKETTGALLQKYHKRPEAAALFNYASMAHNNHFFFNCLSPTSVQIPEGLTNPMNDTASSVESLKLDFLATASSMFGPGFVWLLRNLEHDGKLHILCTYNAGSPYPAAFGRQQSTDSANMHAGSIGAYSKNNTGPTNAPGSLNVQPILCVNTWEHAWMMDYGIAGKDEYLERWWDRVNWNLVLDNYAQAGNMATGTYMQGRRVSSGKM